MIMIFRGITLTHGRDAVKPMPKLPAVIRYRPPARCVHSKSARRPTTRPSTPSCPRTLQQVPPRGGKSLFAFINRPIPDLETLERRHEKYAKVWYLAVAIVLYSLSDNAPLTGRLRLLLPFRLPQDHRLGERDALTSPVAAQLRRLPKNDARAQRVEEVLDRLVSAAGLEHHDLAVEVLESEGK